MVEKTIFIVKPIFIPVEMPSATPAVKTESYPLTSKKKLRLKSKVQTAIYMERSRPPNYTSVMASALADRPKKIKKGTT